MMLEGYLQNPYVLAGLDVISFTEGADYNTLFGGGRFSDYSRHPNRAITAGGYTSTAAGRYQALYRTWAGTQARYGLPDFSPHSQDLFAVAKIADRGALGALASGDLTTFIKKCAAEWASFPNNPYGQPAKTWAQITSYWNADLAARGVTPGAGGGAIDAGSVAGTFEPVETPSGVSDVSLMGAGSILLPLAVIGGGWWLIDWLMSD